MDWTHVLERLQEIEDHVQVADMLESPVQRSSVLELCRIGREMYAQLAVMRAALEAALKEIGEALDEEMAVLCDHPDERPRLPIEITMMNALKSEAGRDLLERLKALEAVAEAAKGLRYKLGLNRTVVIDLDALTPLAVALGRVREQTKGIRASDT